MTIQKLKIGENEYAQIENLFSSKFRRDDNTASINIRNDSINSNISLEIIMDNDEDCLISVYTNNTHLQLQSCSSLIISEMLEEVIFISESESTISGLIVSKQGDCALYSNVDRKSLRSDFSDLNSEKLLAAVALSVSDR